MYFVIIYHAQGHAKKFFHSSSTFIVCVLKWLLYNYHESPIVSWAQKMAAAKYNMCLLSCIRTVKIKIWTTISHIWDYELASVRIASKCDQWGSTIVTTTKSQKLSYWCFQYIFSSSTSHKPIYCHRFILLPWHTNVYVIAFAKQLSRKLFKLYFRTLCIHKLILNKKFNCPSKIFT